MMNLINAMAKENGTIKLEDNLVESQSRKLEVQGSNLEPSPTFKYNTTNLFVIHANKPEVRASEQVLVNQQPVPSKLENKVVRRNMFRFR
ncbi:hypothetical protein V6N13_124887 [Hibiscus sabdariffa]